MSYIRINTALPSGKLSTSYVFPGEKGVLNIARPAGNIDKNNPGDDEECFLLIPYIELLEILRTKTADEIIGIIQRKLDMEAEEAEYIGKKIIAEYQSGKWDRLAQYIK